MPATHEETPFRRRQRERQEARADANFARAQNAARSYGVSLRQYAKQITRIIEHFAEGTPPIVPPHRMPALNEALRRYTTGISPWARATGARMLAEVDRRNLTAWQNHTRGMGAALRKEIATAPVGEEMHALLDYQVELITSMPADAAEYVHRWTIKALEEGQRAETLVEQIAGQLAATPSPTFKAAWEEAYDPEQFLMNRAKLIARTETARAASVLVQARATHVGSETYEWLTSGDWKVRESHRKLNHRHFRWDTPPLSDPPDHHSHPGQIWNCRCVSVPDL